MLILSRKPGQSIIIGGIIEITVAEVRGDQVRLGITAPRSVPVFRTEVLMNQDRPTCDGSEDLLKLIAQASEAHSSTQRTPGKCDPPELAAPGENHE